MGGGAAAHLLLSSLAHIYNVLLHFLEQDVGNVDVEVTLAVLASERVAEPTIATRVSERAEM